MEYLQYIKILYGHSKLYLKESLNKIHYLLTLSVFQIQRIFLINFNSKDYQKQPIINYHNH